MNVESYKRKKNNIYEVKLDTGDKYNLYDDIILKYELLTEKKIDEKKLKKIVDENSLYDAYYSSLKYINLKMRTKYEIRKYLSKHEYSVKSIEYAIECLENEGYLDEDKYAQAYLNDSINLSLIGPKKILDNLKILGIDDSITEQYLGSIDEDVWIKRIKKLIDKKAKTNKVGEVLFKNKMMSELLYQGYYVEHIRVILDTYNLDTDDVFLKEADKVYSKLSSKYGGTDLVIRFKNKMYLKGFDGEKIGEYLYSKQES